MNAPSCRAREQGVALLMTLGVLSLLLILAMSFSFTARTELHLSENNADMVRTRLLTRTALNQVVGILTYQFDEANSTATSVPVDRCIFPATVPATSGGLFASEPLYDDRYVWASSLDASETPDQSELETALAVDLAPNGSAHAFLPRPAGGAFAGSQVSWIHFTGYEPWHDDNNNNAVDSGEYVDLGEAGWGGMLTGRAAYLVVDESAKIDPNGALSLNQEPEWGGTGTYTYYDLNANNSLDTSPSWNAYFKETLGGGVPRSGLSPQEIRLGYYPDEFWADVPRAGGASGPKSEWFSWHQIYRDANIVGDATWNSNAADALRSYFPYSYDKEAYRYTSGGVEDDYHRLDLWAVPWDRSSSTANYWGKSDASKGGFSPCLWLCCYRATSASAGFGGSEPSPFSGTANTDPDTNVHGGAPALAGFTDKDVTQRVLMNLADFCDPDSEASYWPDSGNHWDLSAVGNEAVPYVNEIGFSATYLKDPGTDATDGTADDTGTFLLSVLLEVAEIYNPSSPVSFSAQIRMTLELSDSSSLSTTTYTDQIITISGAANPGAYTVVTANWSPPAPYSGATTPDKISLKINKCEAVLEDATGKLMDYARPLDSITGSPATLQATDIDGTAAVDVRYASLQTDDPRCNTLPTGWPTRHDFGSGQGSLSMTITGTGPLTATGARNESVNPSTASGGLSATAFSTTYTTAGDDYDVEQTTDPVSNLSTAYIANRANITFWELGAVCRGEPWRTINLRKYDAGASRPYSVGDAILFEQIKLGGFTETMGKVNVNCPDPVVWWQVLDGIHTGQKYGDMHDSAAIGSTGNALDLSGNASDLATMAARIATAPVESRGQLVGTATELLDGTFAASGTQNTDRLQEEIVGKLANLLTTRQNLFTVLITAQSVKDTGTANAPGSTQYTIPATGDIRYFKLLSEQRILATLYRDAFTNKYRIVRMEYLED